MKLTIEGSAQEIQKVLQVIAGGEKHEVNISIDQLSKAVLKGMNQHVKRIQASRRKARS